MNSNSNDFSDNPLPFENHNFLSSHHLAKDVREVIIHSFTYNLNYCTHLNHSLKKMAMQMVDHTHSEMLLKSISNHFFNTEQQTDRYKAVFEHLQLDHKPVSSDVLRLKLKQLEHAMLHPVNGLEKDCALISTSINLIEHEIGFCKDLIHDSLALGFKTVQHAMEKTLFEEISAYRWLNQTLDVIKSK